MLTKAFLALLGLAVAFIVLGLSGWLFRLWPTGWPDDELAITPVQLERLHALRREPKFLPDEKAFYPGAPSEEVRVALEEVVNLTIDRLSQVVVLHPRKSTVLAHFKGVLTRAERLDRKSGIGCFST